MSVSNLISNSKLISSNNATLNMLYHVKKTMNDISQTILNYTKC